ncbi:MAG: Nramp family divalent metal transporter [Chloroflexi bacterium]|nr:Nramp family divalent metal transporter [Chloroflexota bacterium]
MHSVVITHGGNLIAAASDNDPTTVATLAVIGASTGYRLAWLVLLLLPMLVVVQVLSTRVAAVSGQNLAQLIRTHLGLGWAVLGTGLVLAVNLFTIAADLEGGAAALSLFTGWDWQWFVVPVTAGIILLLVLGTYRHVARVLSYVMLLFVAYVAATLLAGPDWTEVLRHTVLPSFDWTPDDLAAALSLLGTTLTSYVYIWQSVQEAEQRRPLARLTMAERQAAVGIGGTVVLFWFILVGTGATLGRRGQPVEMAQDAAQALAPLAGPFAAALFGVGLLASAVLALAVLAAASGYVVSATFDRQGRLDTPPSAATSVFYAVVVGMLLVGAGLTLLGVEPIRLLFLAGIAGGVGTPVLLIMLLMLVGSPRVIGSRRPSAALMLTGWTTAVVMSAAAIAYLLWPAVGQAAG